MKTLAFVKDNTNFQSYSVCLEVSLSHLHINLYLHSHIQNQIAMNSILLGQLYLIHLSKWSWARHWIGINVFGPPSLTTRRGVWVTDLHMTSHLISSKFKLTKPSGWNLKCLKRTKKQFIAWTHSFIALGITMTNLDDLRIYTRMCRQQ